MMKRVLGCLAGSTLAFWGGAAVAADGCPTGTYNTTVSPDGKSYSTLFDEWILSGTTDLSTCAFVMPLQNPAPAGNIVVYTSDIRGFYSLEAGDAFELTVDQNGTVSSLSADGPDEQDYTVSDLVAVTGDEITVDGELGLTDSSGNSLGTVDSIDQTEVARITTPTDQTAAVVHLGASAGLLTGSIDKLEGDNEIGIFGGYGSYMLGATGRYNLTDGFSVLGGVSLINQAAGASQVSGVLGSAAVRYVEPGINSIRPMAEGGFVVGALQTTYPGVASPVPTGLGTVYGRGGLVSDLAPETQIAVYGTLAETGLRSDAFTQTFAGPPAVVVNVPTQTGFFTTAKVTAAITTELAPTVDLTAEASGGMVMSHSGMTATIPGIGTVKGAQNSAFIDYGLRLGWTPDPMVSLSLFAQGSVGQDIGAHHQIGATAKLKF